MANETLGTDYSDQDNASETLYRVENLVFNFSTCQEYLQLNLEVFNYTLSDLMSQNQPLLRDSCNNTLLNVTYLDEHPAKYAYFVAYPILLLLCTVGNVLNLIVLSHECRKGTKRWSADIYLIALAVSDAFFMWSQLFDFAAHVSSADEHSSFGRFVNQISGVCSFSQEMFVTSSDWILMLFSVERFCAVAFPLKYNVFISKKRTILVIIAIFVASAAYSSFNLVDYYWFFLHYDPRCPPGLMRVPEGNIRWKMVQDVAALTIPVVTFLSIFTMNLAVAVLLMRQRKFRTLHVRNSLSNEDAHRDRQAIQMLLACAAIYVTTQFPTFVFNVLHWKQRNCEFVFTDNMEAIWSRVDSVLIDTNYSINFFLYYGVSSTFRRSIKEILKNRGSQQRCQTPVTSMSVVRTISDKDTSLSSRTTREIGEKLSLESYGSNKTLLGSDN